MCVYRYAVHVRLGRERCQESPAGLQTQSGRPGGFLAESLALCVVAAMQNGCPFRARAWADRWLGCARATRCMRIKGHVYRLRGSA